MCFWQPRSLLGSVRVVGSYVSVWVCVSVRYCVCFRFLGVCVCGYGTIGTVSLCCPCEIGDVLFMCARYPSPWYCVCVCVCV